MTATPREPTREMEAAYARYQKENGEALLLATPDHFALIWRLCAEAQATKVWTADTIKDAPEAANLEYRAYYGDQKRWGEMLPLYAIKQAMLSKTPTARLGITMAFGPYVAPPPPEEKGG